MGRKFDNTERMKELRTELFEKRRAKKKAREDYYETLEKTCPCQIVRQTSNGEGELIEKKERLEQEREEWREKKKEIRKEKYGDLDYDPSKFDESLEERHPRIFG